MNLYKINKFIKVEELHTITQCWIGTLYRSTASTCWNLLNTGQLSFEETKILFTENIIYNYIEYMKALKNNENKNKHDTGTLNIKRR